MDPHNDEEHRYRRGHDFESRPGLNFSGLSFGTAQVA